MVVIAWSWTAHKREVPADWSVTVSRAYLPDPPPPLGTYMEVGTLSTLIVAIFVPDW